MHAWLRRSLLACLALVVAQLHASSAILIWPLDPVIEADASAVALWVENRGQRTATMQLRVLAWSQERGESRHAPQAEIVGTPAIFRIEPGKRQLLRLTRTRLPPAGVEQAYRVLIDEIPEARGPQAAAAAGVATSGLRFQLRYSIPLFSYGAGLASRRQASTEAARLTWREVAAEGRRWIEVCNPGPRHAKVVDLAVQGDTGTAGMLADGHLGYVLAGSMARWALPDSASRVAGVQARVDGGAPQPIEPGSP